MYPQPELFEDAPGVSRGPYNKLYLHKTEYGTDVIWYHTRINQASKVACQASVLQMGVLYTGNDLYSSGNPPSEDDLHNIRSTNSIICYECGCHIWLKGHLVAQQLANSRSYVAALKDRRKDIPPDEWT